MILIYKNKDASTFKESLEHLLFCILEGNIYKYAYKYKSNNSE